MAASAIVALSARVAGLGTMVQELAARFTDDVPEKVHVNPSHSIALDTEEALPLGDVATVEAVLINAISATTDLLIDTNFSVSFNSCLTLKAGEAQFFKPSGTVYVKNPDMSDAAVFEYLVYGAAT